MEHATHRHPSGRARGNRFAEPGRTIGPTTDVGAACHSPRGGHDRRRCLRARGWASAPEPPVDRHHPARLCPGAALAPAGAGTTHLGSRGVTAAGVSPRESLKQRSATPSQSLGASLIGDVAIIVAMSAKPSPRDSAVTVRVFTNGGSQAITIPRKFRLATSRAKVRRQGSTSWRRLDHHARQGSGFMGRPLGASPASRWKLPALASGSG